MDSFLRILGNNDPIFPLLTFDSTLSLCIWLLSTMVMMFTMDTKYAALLLSTHYLHLHLSDLSSSHAFPLPPFVIFFYCTYYYCMLSRMHYNNVKTNEYRLFDTLLLSCVLYFNCALFLLYFVFIVLYWQYSS